MTRLRPDLMLRSQRSLNHLVILFFGEVRIRFIWKFLQNYTSEGIESRWGREKVCTFWPLSRLRTSRTVPDIDHYRRNIKLHTCFWLVPQSMTLYDIERWLLFTRYSKCVRPTCATFGLLITIANRCTIITLLDIHKASRNDWHVNEYRR